MWWAGLGVLVMVLSATGCAGDSADPTVAEPTTPSTGAPPEPTAGGPSGSSGVTYDAVGVDFCARTDLESLADLSLKLVKRTPKQPTSAPGAACLFELRTGSGHEASLLVEASTLSSADDAGRLYRATRQTTGMSPDGPVSGLGEEAEGFSEQSEAGVKQAEYMIHARSSNLVLKVWLAVGGTTYTPKDVLATKVKKIAQLSLAEVPGS